MSTKIRTADAVKFFGTKSGLARACGVTKQSVNDWGEFVPESREYQLYTVTDGKLGSHAQVKREKARVSQLVA
jgi:hypothetical protein